MTIKEIEIALTNETGLDFIGFHDKWKQQQIYYEHFPLEKIDMQKTMDKLQDAMCDFIEKLNKDLK